MTLLLVMALTNQRDVQRNTWRAISNECIAFSE